MIICRIEHDLIFINAQHERRNKKLDLPVKVNRILQGHKAAQQENLSEIML